MAKTTRAIQRIVTAHRQTEGAGFVVRRPFPTAGLEHIDPFLLIDEMGPAIYGPGQAVGAPDHPHRGFETITYMLDGEFEHEDSAGHKGTIRPGDVQWMTAGGGIIHSEEPSARIRENGGRVHGFQIWLNLPARLKMSQPRYQELPGAKIPTATAPSATGKIIAGSALGTTAVIDTHTPITFQDWTVDEAADFEVGVGAGDNALVYVFGGRIRVGDDGAEVKDGQLALLGGGDTVRLRGVAGERARLLLLAGPPIAEPMARYGPFVMNTQREIAEAIRDFQTGRMGEIVRTARIG